MSWYLFIVLAYPFGGYMMDAMGVVPGVRLGLALTFLVMVPIAAIQCKFVKETLGTGPGAREEAAVSKPRVSLSLLRRAPREVWKLIAVAVLSSFGFQIFWSFVVIYCVEVLGMSKMQWSIVSIVANLVAACFMVPSGFLSDRARRRPYIILSQTLVSLASLGYVLSSGFWGVLLTRVVGGVGEGLGGNVMSSVGGPVWQALVTEVAPMELRGSILGLMGTLTGFLCTPAPMVGGFLYESVSPQSPFYVSLVLGLLGCLIFALFVREPRRARRSENTR